MTILKRLVYQFLPNLRMTLEDTKNQSITTTASLYNGQPTDTGSSRQSARLTSCTPSIQECKDGVSVENVPSENKQWFVLRVSYGRIIKAKAFVEARGFVCYVPLRYKEVKTNSKKRLVTEVLFPSLLFIHATVEQIEILVHNNKVTSNKGIPLLSYYFDHTKHVQENTNHNPPLTIRDEAMIDFIKLTTIKNPHIIPVTSYNIRFKLGDLVEVKEGDFKGIHGRVARIAGQRRVVIELFDGCFIATAYIPESSLIILEHKL